MDMSSSRPSLWFSKRFFVAFVLFLCFVNFQILRNNVNITVVEMTSNKSIIQGNRTITQPAEFSWSSLTVGLVLSILAYGGLLSFLGGIFVDWLGGAVNSSLCLLIAGLTTILHPAALYLDFKLFLACRFVTGMFESFFYVSTADIFARWFPKNERSSLISFSFNGTNVGVALVYPFCGYLAHTWGWQVVFYVTGAMSVCASIFCMIFVKNGPTQDKCISKKELSYILEETESSTTTEINHPYKRILTSGPVWAICIVTFAYMWISTVVGSCLPLYIKDMTQKNTKEIGLLSSIPNIVFIITFPLAGTLMSHWNNRSKISITRVSVNIHKIMMIFACVFSTIALLVITLIPSFVVALLSIVGIQFTTSFMALIIEIVPVNLHSDSSSVIVGMTSVFLSLSAIISQSITSWMVINHSIQEWNDCFLLASSILLLTGVIFATYGSSEAQPWSTAPIRANNRRQSMINVEFYNDSGRLAVRRMGLHVRRVSISRTEIRDRVRRLSIKNLDTHNTMCRASPRSSDLYKAKRKSSLASSSSTSSSKYERKSSIVHEEDLSYNEEDLNSSIEYPKILIDKPITDKPPMLTKSESEPSLSVSNCTVKEECKSARGSSIKNLQCYTDEGGSRSPSIKCVHFFNDDDLASSIDNTTQYSDKSQSETSNSNALKCPDTHFTPSRKSSIKSVQFSDDECGPTIINSNSEGNNNQQRRSSIKNWGNPSSAHTNARRSSLKNTECPKDARRSSIKSVQFQED